jgi:RHS repeat-associated protein
LAVYGYERNQAVIITAANEYSDTVTYSYDDLYRLENEQRNGANAYEINYTFDAVGNRISDTQGGILTSYSYNSRDQLTQKGAVAYSYDAVGRLVGSGGDSYSWVDNDRMSGFSGGSGAQNYVYDHNGLRVQAGGQWYLYDMTLPYGQVIAEFGEDTVAYVYGNERVSETKGGDTHCYLIDGQGSVRGLVDSVGLVVGSKDFNAFGEVISESGVMSDFGYTGEQFDELSKLQYLRARWMNPEAGNFVSVDPHGGDVNSPVSLHRYLYANGSAVSASDPSGNETIANQLGAMEIRGVLATVAVYATYELLKKKAKDTPMRVYHYTKAVFVPHILAMGPGAGLIPPGGKNYMTPDLYIEGTTAQARLALDLRPQVGIQFTVYRIKDNIQPPRPRRVRPINATAWRDGQPGGGLEQFNYQLIPVFSRNPVVFMLN